MKIKKREGITPDLTPLIDVVFILLIFFIVTSVFKKEQLALVLNLPSSKADKLTIKPKEVSIELSVDKLAIFGKEVSFEQLSEALKTIKDKKRYVVLRIDEDVRYEKIVKLLDALQAENLNNLSLITNKNKDER